MTPSPDLAPSLEDHHLARDIAEEAGRRLSALRERGTADLGALGDRSRTSTFSALSRTPDRRIDTLRREPR